MTNEEAKRIACGLLSLQAWNLRQPDSLEALAVEVLQYMPDDSADLTADDLGAVAQALADLGAELAERMGADT